MADGRGELGVVRGDGSKKPMSMAITRGGAVMQLIDDLRVVAARPVAEQAELPQAALVDADQRDHAARVAADAAAVPLGIARAEDGILGGGLQGVQRSSGIERARLLDLQPAAQKRRDEADAEDDQVAAHGS